LPPDNGFSPAPVQQQAQQGALGPYLRALKAHRWMVAIIVLASLAGAIAYLHHRTSHYQATATVLFNPVPSNNEGANGLPVLRESGDPTRLTQTGVSLLDTHQAAVATAERMGPGWTPARVAGAVNVQVQGQSDIIAVTSEASGPALAQRLANAFVLSSLSARQALLRSYAERLPTEHASAEATGQGERRGEDQVAQERAALIAGFAKGQDPNFSLAETAGLPGAPTGTASWLVVLLSIIAGFAIASVAAVVIEMVSDRIRESDELLGLYRLPVLAYVPASPRQAPVVSTNGSGTPAAAAVHEAFRMVRVQLDTGSEPVGEHRRGHVILITSATGGDGKTSSSAAIANALAEAGHEVVLVDLDLRKPDLSRLTGGRSGSATGVTSLLDSKRSLPDVITTTGNPRLRVIPAGPAASAQLLQPVVARLPEMIEELREMADYVVIDTAPLGEVSDAYQFLPFVDDIIIVARPDNTRRASFQFMRDLLMRAHRIPRGIVIVGEGQQRSSYYYGSNAYEGQRLIRRWLDRANLVR
jgi:tyrosine-protein kinase